MTILGKSDGREVKLSDKKRTKGLYCIGKTGTGKTTFLVNLAVQDIQNGHGICYLDPHGDAIRDILKRIPYDRIPDVIYLNVEDNSFPFGLNLFDCPDPTSDKAVALTASFVTHVFEKIWGAGADTPRLSEVLRNVSATMIENPGTTFLEARLLLSNERVRTKLISHLRNQEVKEYWETMYNQMRPHEQREYVSSTTNKINTFLTQPMIRNIIGQSKTTVDLRSIMDERKVLLVQLSPRFEDITSLVGTMLIGKILHAAYSRADTQERPFFGLYADEYQKFATADFNEIVTEARKYFIGLVMAHQVRSQLDEKAKGATLNAANLVVFRVSGQDADELKKEFAVKPEPGEPVLEQITEPAIEAYTVEIWTPPEAKQEWERRKKRISDLKKVAGVYNKKIHIDKFYTYYDRMHKGHAGWLDFEDERVQNYLLQYIYVPDSTIFVDQYIYLRDKGRVFLTEHRFEWIYSEKDLKAFEKRIKDQKLEKQEKHQYIVFKDKTTSYILVYPEEHRKKLRNPSQLTYRFPSYLPTELETNLEKSSWGTQEEVKKLLIQELRGYFANLKEKAMYTYRMPETERGIAKDFLIQGDWIFPEFPKLGFWQRRFFPELKEHVRKLEEKEWQFKRDHYRIETRYRDLGYLRVVKDREYRQKPNDWGMEVVEIPRYRLKEGLPRPIADRQNEIANELVTLPPYTARVRLEREEYLLTTLPFSQGMRDDELDEIILYIQEMNEEDGYCRDKSTVEAEIAKRQKDLRGRDDDGNSGQRIIDIDL